MNWARPAAEYVEHVAKNVRPQDEIEVFLSDEITGYVAVMESFYTSDVCRVILGDDSTPVGVTGVCEDRIWLLGTPELTKSRSHRWQLAVHGREWVNHCIDVVGGPVGNHVYSENRESVRWLKHLGFDVLEEAPYGPKGALFHEFWSKS